MKKFSLLFTTALVSAVAVVFFISCQKEQSSVSTNTDAAAATSENARIGIASSGPYAGSINNAYAAALAANYAKQFGANNQSQSVAFSAKDLIAFINQLQTKYKSDVIYVNFGLYGKGAPAVDSRNNGRLTVFFTGNKIPAPSTSHRSDVADGTTGDQFLNHGDINPPPSSNP